MRTLRWAIAAFLLAAAAGCRPAGLALPATAGDGRTPGELPGPAATATEALSPIATSVPGATATALPVVEGPLVAEGQVLRDLFIAPSSPQVRYGTLTSGLVRSEDAGRTWRHASDLSLPPLFVSPHDPQTLYASDVAPCLRGDEAPPFRISTDGGLNWLEVPAGRGVKPVAESPGALGTLYGISCSGLNVSRDGGQTWQLTGPTEGWEITSIIPGGSGRFVLLAALTSEGGTTHLAWFNDQGQLELNLTEGLNFWARGALATDGSNVYVADSTGVWRNSDGKHWDLFEDGLTEVVLPFDPLKEGFPEQGVPERYGLNALAIDPADVRHLVLGTARGLHTSYDRGEHWRPAGVEALADSRIQRITWDPSAANTLYATTPEGVFLVRLPAQ